MRQFHDTFEDTVAITTSRNASRESYWNQTPPILITLLSVRDVNIFLFRRYRGEKYRERTRKPNAVREFTTVITPRYDYQSSVAFSRPLTVSAIFIPRLSSRSIATYFSICFREQTLRRFLPKVTSCTFDLRYDLTRRYPKNKIARPQMSVHTEYRQGPISEHASHRNLSVTINVLFQDTELSRIKHLASSHALFILYENAASLYKLKILFEMMHFPMREKRACRKLLFQY